MKELEFMELLGELPAEYIEAASKPQKKQRRFAWLRYGLPAVAACFAVVILAAVYPRLKSPDIPSVDSQPEITIETTAETYDEKDVTTTAAEAHDPELSEQSESQGHRTTMTTTVSTARSDSDSADDTTAQHTDAHTNGNDNHDNTDEPAHTTKATQNTSKTDEGHKTSTTLKTTRPTTTKTPQTTTTKRSTHIVTTTAATRHTTTTRAPKTARTTAGTTAAYSFTSAVYGTTGSPEATQKTGALSTQIEEGSYPISHSDHSGSGQTTTTEPIPSQDEREVLKWQVYDPDPLYSDWENDFYILSDTPAWDDDTHQQLRDFDFDRYNCLVIHLRTNATDAVLTTLNLSSDYSTINSMIFRQPTDPTTRHFVFAVAVPKDFELRYDPDFVLEATDDASFYYSAVPSESDVYYEGEW